MHPMDPLSALEYSAVIATLQELKYVDDSSRYPLITLREPPKARVLQWRPGDGLARQAFVIVKNGAKTFEAVVNVTQHKVFSWKEVEGVQPGILPTEEWASAQEIVRANRDWQAAVKKRGIENSEDVVCMPLTVGYYGMEEEGQRLVKVASFDSRGVRNYWGRPIEGLTAVVDLDRQKVIRLIDTGVLPIPRATVDIDEDSVGRLREPPHSISITQSQGPSFKLDGHMVRWQKWRFHFRIDPRLGPVISVVHYNDNGKERSILYQGSVSELFVPYMDPDAGWYFRTYMDAGEYGVGKLAAPMEPGLDCPSNAVFLDALFADDRGASYIQQRAACVFERYAGDVAWRHYEAVNGQSEVRR